MFMLTPAAAEQIARAALEQPDNPPLRVAAKFDVDGELVYGMGFDAPRDDDLVISTEGVQVLIAPPSQSLLVGAALDFVEIHPGEYQFIFSHAEPPTPSLCASQRDAGAPTGCGGCGKAQNNGGNCA